MSGLLNVLTALFAHRVEGAEPRIVELETPIQIIGLERRNSVGRRVLLGKDDRVQPGPLFCLAGGIGRLDGGGRRRAEGPQAGGQAQ